MTDRNVFKQKVTEHFNKQAENCCKNIDLIFDWVEKHITDRVHNKTHPICFYKNYDCVFDYDIISPVITIIPISKLVDIGGGIGEPFNINLSQSGIIQSPQTLT